MSQAVIKPSGEAGLLVKYGEGIDPRLNAMAVSASDYIRREGPEGILDVVPANNSVLVLYEPWRLEHGSLLSFLEGSPEVITPRPGDDAGRPVKIIPTVYGGDYGPDMAEVCQLTSLTENDVVRLHTGREYRVYFLGFTPGYAYMGEVAEELSVPRVTTPRQKVPMGTVAIAGRQTGIYPYDSPSGWRLIGRTPLRLFSPETADPVFFAPGDRVRFEQISPEEHRRLLDDRPEDGETGEPAVPLFRVVSPGLLTTVQDRGRFGSMHLGASRTGPADLSSFMWANGLVGNGADEAGLEITAVGPVLAFERDAVIAITGAGMDPLLDGKPLAMWRSVRVKSGSMLSFGGLKEGLRAYVAVAGGLDVPEQLGSRATDTVSGFGGFLGRALRPGDILGVNPVGPEGGDGRSAPTTAWKTETEVTVRAVSGPQDDHFTAASRRLLESQAFSVRSDSNRMGLRLQGDRPIPHSDRGPDIDSEGICPGAIQVPGSGQPIVMLANAQTTGGYAKIATVITPDLSLLGQVKPGDSVRFRLVSLADALSATRSWWRSLDPAPEPRARYLVEAGGKTMVVDISAAKP